MYFLARLSEQSSTRPRGCVLHPRWLAGPPPSLATTWDFPCYCHILQCKIWQWHGKSLSDYACQCHRHGYRNTGRCLPLHNDITQGQTDNCLVFYVWQKFPYFYCFITNGQQNTPWRSIKAHFLFNEKLSVGHHFERLGYKNIFCRQNFCGFCLVLCHQFKF